MALMQRLEMRQGQALVMTPQLLQAIKLLQLSHLDLAAYVEGELERNPLLERDGPDSGPDDSDAAAARAESESPDEGAGSMDGEAAEPWFSEDLQPSRSDLEGDLDTRLDNVFPEEATVPERPRFEAGEGVPLAASPWTSVGSGGHDGEAPDFEARLTAEPTLQ